MSKLKHIIAFVAIIIASFNAVAQQGSISIQANAQVVQGSRFQITVRLENCDGSISQAPQLRNCTLLYGPSTSTIESMSYVNGHMSRSVIRDYGFTYVADHAGQVTIPSISVSDNGRTLRSKPYTFTILPPGRDERRQQPGSAPAQPVNTGSSAQVSPNDLIVQVSMSKQNVYEQEAVIATIKVYTKHNILSFRATTLPSFDGFLSEELPVKEEPKIEHFRGDNYYSAVLKRCLLYPQKDGKLTINSGRYDVTLELYEIVSNGFFATRRPIEKHITTASNQVTVNVSPLPQPQPAGFSGAVGVYNIKQNLEPSLLRTNDAATYTIDLTGTGNIKYVQAPAIDFGSMVEAYDPETTNNASFNGSDMTGSAKFTYTIVPQQVGTLEIPSRPFVYFNPQTRQYVTLTLPAISRKIIKGSDTSSSTTGGKEKKLDDILHIANLSNVESVKHPEPLFYSPLYLLSYIVILGGLLGAIFIYRRQIKLEADEAGRRNARANRVANRRLKAARKCMESNDTEGFYTALATAIWGYLGDKLGIPSSALTRDNISEKLETYGANEEAISNTISLLDLCEMARFTPVHNEDRVHAAYNDAVALIRNLEDSANTKK